MSEVIVEKRVTEWFIWKCPRPKCRTKIESTKRKFTEYRAALHLGKHDRIESDDRKWAMNVQAKIEA